MVIAGLFGGIGAGLAGAALAFSAGHGLLVAMAVYVLAGMLGMILSAVAVALCPNRREEGRFAFEGQGENALGDH
jgi:hypothetical protein